MGYDLHITRKEHWADEEQNSGDISLEEWLAYIYNPDSELELSDGYRIKIPGIETNSQVAPGFCEWAAHPLNKRPWFNYSDGNISTKYPDEATVGKMILMAEVLNAKVQGDDGEVYELSNYKQLYYGDGYSEPLKMTKNKQGKPWWKFW